MFNGVQWSPKKMDSWRIEGAFKERTLAKLSRIAGQVRWVWPKFWRVVPIVVPMKPYFGFTKRVERCA